MASGNFSVKSSNQYVAATAKWNAVKNIEGNYSLLNIELRASRTNSGYTTYGTGSGYFVINGKKYTFSITSSQKITQNSNTLLGSVSNIKIPHNSDGNKNLTIEVYASIPGAGLTLGTTSKTVALDTIPRATTPTFSPESVRLGESVTIKLLRASSNFTHTLKYKFGEQTGTLVTGAGVSHIWQVPLDFARQIPNSESGNCTITCDTYNGNVLIGSKAAVLTLEVPDTMLPVITSINVSETVAGVAEKFGQYLKDISKLQIEVAAEGVYGSSIKSYAISVLDIVYNGASIVTNTLTQAGEIVATITIKDSRGKSFTAEENIVVADYAAPMIKHFTVTRASADGTLAHDGTCASCNANFIIAPISNRNNRTYLVEYRRTGEETWHRAISGSLYSFDGVLLSGEILDPNYSYYVRLTVSDYFGSIAAEAEVGTSKPIWNARRDKKGFAFGKVAELEGFLEINFKTFFYKFIVLKNMVAIMMENAKGQYRDVMHMTATNNLKIGYDSYDKSEGSTDICGKDINFMSRNGIWINGQLFADFVIEQGTSGIWTYEKWASGKVELWGLHSVTLAIDNPVGNCYRSAIQYAPLPFTVYNMQHFVGCTDLNTWASNGPGNRNGTTIPYVLWRGAIYGSYTWYTKIHVIGRWKE